MVSNLSQRGAPPLVGCRVSMVVVSTSQSLQHSNVSFWQSILPYVLTCSNFQDDHTPFEETGIDVQGLIRAEEIDWQLPNIFLYVRRVLRFHPTVSEKLRQLICGFSRAHSYYTALSYTPSHNS